MDLTTHYVDHLSAEGFRPKVDSEEGGRINYVRFKYQGKLYTAQLAADDETFFYLYATFSLGVPKELELQALKVAHDLQLRLKGIKIGLDFEEDGVSFAIETFLASAADFRTVLPRALEAIQLATDQFFTNLRAQMAQG